MNERITILQIIDDFFHEYQEGRLERDKMGEAILKFARQYYLDTKGLKERLGISGHEYTCYMCGGQHDCIYAYDDYNTNGDCLADK